VEKRPENPVPPVSEKEHDMTPELKTARIAEAWRLSDGTVADAMDHLGHLYETNWTPPEPVDPDLLAAREWMKEEGYNAAAGSTCIAVRKAKP
jgi:hypothetical protein